jgi:hypothetical protein
LFRLAAHLFGQFLLIFQLFLQFLQAQLVIRFPGGEALLFERADLGR